MKTSFSFLQFYSFLLSLSFILLLFLSPILCFYLSIFSLSFSVCFSHWFLFSYFEFIDCDLFILCFSQTVYLTISFTLFCIKPTTFSVSQDSLSWTKQFFEETFPLSAAFLPSFDVYVRFIDAVVWQAACPLMEISRFVPSFCLVFVKWCPFEVGSHSLPDTRGPDHLTS